MSVRCPLLLPACLPLCLQNKADLERISAAIGTGRTAEQVRVFMQREAQRVHARGIPFSISGITLPPPPPAPVAAPPPPSAPGVARAGPPPLAAAQVQARPPSAAAAPSMRSPPAPPTLQPKHFQFRPPPGSLIPAPAPTGQQVSSSFQGTMLAPKASAPPGSPSPRPVGSPTGSVLAAQQNTVPVGGPKNAGPPAVAKASPPPPPKG
uniref:Uncharacterized protein n=1 Tax=Chromera velia CCMP2878 TaxID=1169474 RepID=A0A0G4F9D5_9ALVE|eukprot:Cvel_172.t1-p1 / transcript=Cvel_172.t1 / gene=Cvel_172 / organism=Chromera_velia_CCMP2878 / gene_product=hypothetical protein / transcript_product=hypothetical protein / location=Cvel_scaffold11:647-1935(+) / protein_length=207 / sequence_SO=supercontig / SO=protein_coding / is_pseudo=false